MNGRVYCQACDRVTWVIAHPDAEISCRYCEGPTVKGSWDAIGGKVTALDGPTSITGESR